MNPLRTVVVTACLAFLATGCGGTADVPDDSRITVTASTNVWASVVRAVGADAVRVEALISDPATDPHSYESTPADAARVTRAGLVVFNGGGYDGFMERILSTAGDRPTVEVATVDSPVTRAVAAREAEGDRDGHGHSGEAGGTPANEHFWYDLTTTAAAAHAIAARLGEIKPEARSTFEENARVFAGRITGIQAGVAEIAGQQAGGRVLMSEPLAANLALEANLTDATPREYAEAVEAGTDPSVAAVAEIERLVESREVRVLIYNPQTETPVTRRLRDKAVAAGHPVVEMTETLPADRDYLDWMAGNVANLTSALKRP